MSAERVFLQMLNLMTGVALTRDGYRWYIRDIGLLPEGPCASFYFDWYRSPQGTIPGHASHDSFSCMTLRMEHGRPVLRHETCSLGPLGTAASQALQNRFQHALRMVVQ